MGNQGKSGLNKIMGSVTAKVLELSERLLLVVPPNYTFSQVEENSENAQTIH
jgi:hypothetical protein